MKPVLLCILDGWGIGGSDNNAIAEASTPNWDRILEEYPNTELQASGLDVGLPEGQMGNSEVGHMNIGGGRIMMQNLPLIDTSIADGSLKSKLGGFIHDLKESDGRCHLFGMISDGGVHSHINHIIALSDIISEAGIDVVIHAVTDGRDTPPENALNYLSRLKNIATVSGRYYAMDRDNRWERVKLAYDAIVDGKGERFESAAVVIQKNYNNDITDEFILPAVIDGYDGMKDGDGLLMANFRSDRVRQILAAFLDTEFTEFECRVVKFAATTGMVEYSKHLTKFISPLFPRKTPDNVLGKIIADAGLKQLRIAETEKYAHVTFFFNGGIENQFQNEDRVLVPSPKVATYDKQPEMSAVYVTNKLINALDSCKYDLIIANYANTDMVGHTGVMEAAKVAVKVVDNALGKLIESVKNNNGIMIVTADHGNADLMVEPKTGNPHTAHTLNPVPFVVIGSDITLEQGRLCDISPTILKLMGIPVPKEMTGKSLIKQKDLL